VSSWQPLVFFGLSSLVVVASSLIAFSKNLVYSAFALLGTFAGVAGYFVLLGADFAAVAQVLVYIGGIMVLYLFAVLMTAGIGDVKVTNRSIAVKWAVPATLLLLILLAKLIYGTKWFVAEQIVVREPTTSRIGDMLLTEYLLPFEVVSILLLGVLVGAVALARRGVGEGNTKHG
jgi:NADH-quinone oxidoreductase subunit J